MCLCKKVTVVKLNKILSFLAANYSTLAAHIAASDITDNT